NLEPLSATSADGIAMVTISHFACSAKAMLFAAQQSSEPVLEQLTPPRRAAVIMAFLGLTLIGLFLILFTMVGAHWVRRLARHRPGSRRVDFDSAATQRLQDAF